MNQNTVLKKNEFFSSQKMNFLKIFTAISATHLPKFIVKKIFICSDFVLYMDPVQTGKLGLAKKQIMLRRLATGLPELINLVFPVEIPEIALENFCFICTTCDFSEFALAFEHANHLLAGKKTTNGYAFVTSAFKALCKNKSPEIIQMVTLLTKCEGGNLLTQDGIDEIYGKAWCCGNYLFVEYFDQLGYINKFFIVVAGGALNSIILIDANIYSLDIADQDWALDCAFKAACKYGARETLVYLFRKLDMINRVGGVELCVGYTLKYGSKLLAKMILGVVTLPEIHSHLKLIKKTTHYKIVRLFSRLAETQIIITKMGIEILAAVFENKNMHGKIILNRKRKFNK